MAEAEKKKVAEKATETKAVAKKGKAPTKKEVAAEPIVARKRALWDKGWKLALWGILMAVWVTVVLVAVQYALSYGIYWMNRWGWISTGLIQRPGFLMGYEAVVYAASLALAILLPWKVLKYKVSRNELGLYGLPTWTDILLGPIGLILALILGAIVVFIAEKLMPWVDWEQEQDVGFNILANSTEYLVAFFALVVVAPFCEEVLFRGWLYGKLRGRMSALPAIIITSITFGVVHGQWNVGVTVFAMSIIMCLARELTGTIYCGMIIHILKNALAFYMLYVANPLQM